MKEIYFQTIDSTNTYLKNNYSNLENFTFVRAGIQTAGKGRNNRTWVADENNLLFSLLIKEEVYFKEFKKISILAAYSVAKVLQKYGLKEVQIKWPNDVYIQGKKVCGILLESVSKQQLECLIVGIGINVNQEEFTGEHLIEPTSIYNQLGKKIDLEEFKDKVYSTLLDHIQKIFDYDFYPEISKFDYLKDKQAYALVKNKKQKIKVFGINEDYSLKIQVNDEVLNIETGEISFHV